MNTVRANIDDRWYILVMVWDSMMGRMKISTSPTAIYILRWVSSEWLCFAERLGYHYTDYRCQGEAEEQEYDEGKRRGWNT